MSEPVAEQLPDDIDALKSLLLQKQQRIRLLEEQILLLRNKRFSSSSEKVDSGQLGFFNEAETVVDEDAEDPASNAPATETVTYTRKRPAGRKPLAEDLPRVRIEHDLPEQEKVCTCGCQMQAIGEIVSEQLDIIPAKIQVLQQVRKKYACKACENGVKTTPLPPQPIPKSNASPGLLAHIAVAKYQDALPLARQAKIFRRIGVDLPRNTLANWIIRSSELVQPPLNLFDDQLREGLVIQCDETPLQVLKEPDKPTESQSYMWVRLGGTPEQKVVLYDYHSSRSGAVANTLLSGFNGYLQTDDYVGYHAIGTEQGITHLGCWAHARHKFVEAQKVAGGKVSKQKREKAARAC